MQIDGACHCGLISFTAEIDPTRVMVCHCSNCQVLSGSPFRVSVAAPMETFVLRGQPKTYIKIAESGNRRAQVFCPECATPLFAGAGERHFGKHSPRVRPAAYPAQPDGATLAALFHALAA